MKTTALAAALTAIAASPVFAERIFTENILFQENLCIGSQCVSGETFPSGPLLLKRPNVRIVVDDYNVNSGYPDNDWQIRFNDSNLLTGGGLNRFSIEDTTNGTIPFTIVANAPDNRFWMSSGGNIGIGTTLPQADLNIAGNVPALRLDHTATTTASFQIELNGSYLNFRNKVDGATVPFQVWNTAPNGALSVQSLRTTINENGDAHDFGVVQEGGSDSLVQDYTLYADASTDRVGVGTTLPDARLHVRGEDGDGTVLIEETSAGTLGQLTLRNNGITFFTLEDTSIAAGDYSGREWNFQNQAGTFRVTTPPGGPGEIEMLLDPNGDMTIRGQLYTGGTCAAGCDAVFDDDYPLLPIDERAAQMRALGHLPNVGPTPENGPFNLSRMATGMLNELEHAHLYIAALNERVARLEAELKNLKAQD